MRFETLAARGLGAILACLIAMGFVASAHASNLARVQNPHARETFTVSQFDTLRHRLQAWQPQLINGEKTSIQSEPMRDPASLCPRGEKITGSSDQLSLTLLLYECKSAQGAYQVVAGYAGDLGRVALAPDHSNLIRFVSQEHRAQAAWRVRGAAFALLLRCRHQMDCEEQLDPIVTQVMASTRGLPIVDPQAADSTGLFLTPLVLWLCIVLPFRLIQRLRRPKWESHEGPRYEDLTNSVRRHGLRRSFGWSARAVGTLLLIAGVAGLIAGLIPPRNLSSVLIGICLSLLGTGAVVLGLRFRRIPRRASLHTERHGLRSALGSLLETASVVLIALTIALFLLTSLLSYAAATAELDPLFEAWAQAPEDGIRSISALVVFTFMMGQRGNESAIYVQTLLPLLAIGVFARSIARRLLAADLAAALTADPRPPILYLRAFAEDRLKVPSVTIRRTLGEILLSRRTRRFEEVLAWSLSRYGPVTAISPPGKLLPDLGAAKTHLPHDQWQSAVWELAARAQVVVVSGTPPEVRPGLAFELAMLGSQPHGRILIVQAPWPKRSLQQRWRGFVAEAIRHPLFGPLSLGWVQPGTHVLAHISGSGWWAWGATTRTDVSYTLAIDHAFALAGEAWTVQSGPGMEPPPV